MKLATWNVNSLRVRLPQLLDWLAIARPDLLALQETKVADEEFPRAEIEAAGYRVIHTGQKGYNGVAILSRPSHPGDVTTRFPGVEEPERRMIAASYGALRVINLYVPNGQEVGSEPFDYKLDWLAHLARHLRRELSLHRLLAVTGDLNTAPDERDVYDPLLWEDQVLFSGPERAAFRELLETGLVDVVRVRNGDTKIYSWWDYRFNAFKGDRGLRIDHILASHPLAALCTAASVDKRPRGWPRPSDHAPVVAEFAL